MGVESHIRLAFNFKYLFLYLKNLRTSDAGSPIEIFFGAFTNPDSEFDKKLVADIISALNVNELYPRSEFNFQYCAAIIDGYKKQFG